MLAGRLCRASCRRQAEDYVAAILQSVERLGQMIDDVLDLTQSDAGALPLERAPIDLVALAGECGEAQHRRGCRTRDRFR